MDTDIADGGRDHRARGVVVIDVASGETVCTALSMPHSPRLHDGWLYVLNSVAGEFGRVDLNSGRFEPIALCPGYLRGLAFLAGHAIVGLSERARTGPSPACPSRSASPPRGAPRAAAST